MLNVFKIISIICLSILSYGLTLEGDFVFDDSEAIVNNDDVLGSTPVSDLLIHDFWGSNISSIHSHKSYRPLTVLTFRLHYLLTDDSVDAFEFKFINLICHTVCCMLVWWTYRLLIGNSKTVPDVGFLAALLFTVHPVHVEAVSGIVGRADLLAAIFFFMTLICYIKSTKKYISNFDRLIYPVLCFIFSSLSMLSKEIGITVLGVSLTYEVIYLRANFLHCFPFIKNLLREHKVSKLQVKQSLHRIVFIVMTAAVLLAFRWAIMGNSMPSFQETDNPASFHENFFTRVMSYQYIYFLNILLLVWPFWLCFDWSMGCVPLIESPLDQRIFCVAVIYSYFIKFIDFVMRPEIGLKQKRLILMSMAMMVIPFLPATNILFTVGFVVAERLLYIPSAGFCLLVCLGFAKLMRGEYKKHFWFFYVLYGLLLVGFLMQTMRRSRDWQTDYRLFNSGLSVCPDNAKVHYNVAKLADANNELDRAIHEYEEAIRLNPKYHQAMNNLANLLKNQVRFEEAQRYLRKAIELKPEFAAAWMNLGIVLANTKRYDEARDAYVMAIAYRNNYPDCYYNLGNLYFELGKHEPAIDAWNKSIALNPKHRLAWNNLLALLDNTGQIDKALELLPVALKELPNAPAINFIAANIFGKLDRFEESEEHFIRAIILSKPNVKPIYYANLGVLYHRWKKYTKAEESYQNALDINSTMKSALDNIKAVRKLIKRNSKPKI